MGKARGALLGALTVLVAAAAAREPRGTLSGKLVDATNGRAVPGAEVRLIVAGTSRITGVDGRFTFGELDVVGPDTLVVRHLAYDSVRLSIDRDLGPLDIQLDLNPAPIPVEGVDVAVRARVQEEARHLADMSGGVLWEREEFERYARSAWHVADPLRWSGKVSYIVENDDGTRCVIIRMRHGCARILLNNVYVSPETLLALSPQDIESYVIIGPIDATLLYGTDAAPGVVVIYTRGRG